MKKILLGIIFCGIFLFACLPANPQADTNLARVNAYRAAYGVNPLPRVYELDLKAQAWAQVMANNGVISHSRLDDGVPGGWRFIGENVAVAVSVEVAQQTLEASPPHLANIVNYTYNQIGIGVINQGGRVWLVQVFVAR